MHLSPIRDEEVLVDVFCWFGIVIVLGIFIAVYDPTDFRRCLDVADDTIEEIPLIYNGVPGYLFFSVVALVVVVSAVSFHGLVEVCRSGHPIYVDGIFVSVLYGASDLESAHILKYGPNQVEWCFE